MVFPVTAGRPVVLFDLDGTLLPLEMEAFERAYFKLLCPRLPELTPQEAVRAVWAGTKAMAANDGSRTNREAFADVFSRESGLDFYAREADFLDFYRTDFQQCAAVCELGDLSRRIVDVLREKGYTTAIATNPIFPEIATFSRLQWLGLDPASFPLVTTYENCRFAKPSLNYYRDVCARLHADPAQCWMVGNDVEEDGCARRLGIEVLLVTDHLYNPKNLPFGDFPAGSLADVLAWAEALPPVQTA